jgi:hypothetical protein
MEGAVALYTFYPRQAGGAALTLESYEDADDASALRRAREILRQHPSSAWVSVWIGDRLVGEVEVEGAAAGETVTGSSV